MEKIYKEMNELFVRKNHDYGNSFHRTFAEEGYATSRIRLADKIYRVEQLGKGDIALVEESLRDTLVDLANYAVLTAMESVSIPDQTDAEVHRLVCDEFLQKALPASPNFCSAFEQFYSELSGVFGRFKALSRRETPQDEDLQDCLAELANRAVQAVVDIDSGFDK